jgi:hypothetical protein
MIEVKVKNDNGEVLNLSTSPNYTLYDVTGVTPLQMNINTSVNATSDGETVNSVRANKRNIVLYVAIHGVVEVNRLNLYKYFPPKKNVTIYCKTGNRNVYIEGITEIIDVKLFSNQQVAQVSIICAQPYFKDVDELITSFSQIESLFSFPFSIADPGTELSIIGNDIRKNIINTGEVDTGMIIELFAISEVVKPVIYDVLNRTHIKLEFTMQANDIIYINTHSGQKSITLLRDGVETNIISYLAYSSKWLKLHAGDNVFTYDAESGVSNIKLTFRTLALYGGV